MSSAEQIDTRTLAQAGLCGLLFGLGLAISGMTDPNKVLDFLDLGGEWDPSLALVMVGALAVSAPTFAWVRKRGRAACGTLHWPTNTGIDRNLLLGAALFGIGWGLAGYCPGPALATLTRGSLEPWLFVPAMFFGSWLGERWATKR